MGKILFVATVDLHIKAFHLPYLKFLHDNGNSVHVVTNGKEQFENCDKKYTICIERNPFKINNVFAIYQLKKIIENEKYDLIHCHTPMGAVVARLAAKKARLKYGTKVIYTAHGFHFYKGASKIKWFMFFPIEWFLSKYTDTIIIINKEDEKIAKKMFKNRCNKIEYVPGVGIDNCKFDEINKDFNREKSRNDLGLKDSDFVMIYPAELSKRKNQTWLISSIKELIYDNNDIHLLLPGKDSLNGKCMELTEKLGLSNNIHFLGFRNDIPKLMRLSDVAISSSLQEGLPVNIMEAMYLGLPIICSNCRGNKDLVIQNVNGEVFEINDTEAIKNSILKLYKNKNLRKKYGNEGHLLAVNYRVDHVLKLYEDIYNEYLGVKND